MSNISLASDDSDVFYMEQSSTEPSPRRHNTPDIFNSTELSEHHTARMPSVSSIASPQPQIITIKDDSNEPTMPYGFGRQLPIVPPSLNDLNLPPNPFNILATMTVVDPTEDDNNDGYSPQSPDPSDPSPISTPPMNVSTFNSWETTHTTTDDNTFHSSDEPRRILFLPLSPSPPPSPPRRQKRKLSLGMSFPQEGGVSQHVCKAGGQTIPSTKDIPGPSKRKKNCVKLTFETIKLITLFNKSCILIVCTYMGTYIYVHPLTHKNTNSLRRWHVVATCHPTLFQS